MRWIVVGFLVVFWSIVGWLSVHAEGVKEPTYPPYCWVQPEGQDLWFPCDSTEAQTVQCNHVMELAMKAVDPETTPKDPTPAEAEALVKQWMRAKNMCWSDRKNLQPRHFH